MQFQLNMKKTALGVRFGKTLFTNPSKFSPKQIAGILKALGLNIPKEVEITADLAQVIVSGSALIKAYNAAETGSDLKSVVKASEVTITLGTKLGRELGWFDDDFVSEVSVGISVAQLFASGGTDIKAWAALGLELGMQSEKAKAQATMLAQKGVIDNYKSIISKQSQNMVQNLTDLKNGQVGIFGFIAESAYNSNVLFPNVILKNENFQKLFPGLALIPVGKLTIRSDASVRTWYGDTKSDSFQISIDAIPNFKNPLDAAKFIFRFLIEPFCINYLEAESYYLQTNKASLFQSSILMMLEGDGYFDRGQDMVPLFKKHLLTPSDLGDFETLNQISSTYNESAIFGFNTPKNLSKEEILSMQKQGKILSLMDNKQVQEKIKSRYSYSYFPEMQTEVNIDWRELSNFIAALDYLDACFSDPYMKKFITDETFQKYQGINKINSWKKKFEECYNKSLVRKVSLMSLSNIAYYMQTTGDKIQYINNSDGSITVKG